MFVQNYGWPTGPAKIWLWVASGQLEARLLYGISVMPISGTK